MVFPSWVVESNGGFRGAPDRVAFTQILTEDGEILAGLWRPPQPGRPVIVSFHGNASSPVLHAERFSQGSWFDDGWGILAIAWRGYPGSTGVTSEAGLRHDTDAAMAFVRENAPNAPIVAHGHSLGAYGAIWAARKNDVMGLFLEAPFVSVAEIAATSAWWVPRPILDVLLRHRLENDVLAPGIQAPVFIAVGGRDAIVPPGTSRRLARLFPGQVALFEAPFADHVNIFGAADETAREFFIRAPLTPPRVSAFDEPGR